MKFCTKCGKEIFDEAVICPGCGCATGASQVPNIGGTYSPQNCSVLLQTLSSRVKTDAIIWLVIGCFQVLFGFFAIWTLVVGVLNIIAAISDFKFSKEVLNNPIGVVGKFEPLVGPIITLIYNLLIGGIIGVAGSIYYFVGVRNYVMENKAAFLAMEEDAKATAGIGI